MSAKRGVLVRPDRMERVAIRGLEDMQSAVGGDVQALTLAYGTAYFDEDGLMKRLPYNVIGSLLCGRDIVGNVLVLGPVVEGEDTDLPEEAMVEINILGRQAMSP